MKENHKFKIGDHVMHIPTGTHTVWEISGYGENGYMVKEHLDSVRILYEKEDEWELYDSEKYTAYQCPDTRIALHYRSGNRGCHDCPHWQDGDENVTCEYPDCPPCDYNELH